MHAPRCTVSRHARGARVALLLRCQRHSARRGRAGIVCVVRRAQRTCGSFRLAPLLGRAARRVHLARRQLHPPSDAVPRAVPPVPCRACNTGPARARARAARIPGAVGAHAGGTVALRRKVWKVGSHGGQRVSHSARRRAARGPGGGGGRHAARHGRARELLA
eukprot:38183-Chlamydomonas_euryale.AAC.2